MIIFTQTASQFHNNTNKKAKVHTEKKEEI